MYMCTSYMCNKTNMYNKTEHHQSPPEEVHMSMHSELVKILRSIYVDNVVSAETEDPRLCCAQEDSIFANSTQIFLSCGSSSIERKVGTLWPYCHTPLGQDILQHHTRRCSKHSNKTTKDAGRKMVCWKQITLSS